MQVAQQNYNEGIDAHTATIAQNMEAAMNVLMNGLKANGNSIIGALGNYNGWYTGITKTYSFIFSPYIMSLLWVYFFF